MKRLFALFFLFSASLLMTIFCVGLIHGSHGADHQPRSVSPKPSSARVFKVSREEIIRHYSWEDINGSEIIGQRGDRYIVERGSKTETCRLAAIIDAARLKEVVKSYGVPESWLHFRYTSEQDRRRKIEDIQQRIATRGFIYAQDNNTITADYRWFVDHSVSDMRDTAISLKNEAVRVGHQNTRQLNGVIATFVQSMTYRIPPDIRRDHDGQNVFTGGITMPLETLYHGYGDCDTKTVLFASIMKNFEGAEVILLKGNGHMFAGFRMEPRMYEKYILLQGEKYVLVELTTPWRLGHVPQEHLHALRLKKLEVVPLFE